MCSTLRLEMTACSQVRSGFDGTFASAVAITAGSQPYLRGCILKYHETDMRGFFYLWKEVRRRSNGDESCNPLAINQLLERRSFLNDLANWSTARHVHYVQR